MVSIEIEIKGVKNTKAVIQILNESDLQFINTYLTLRNPDTNININDPDIGTDQLDTYPDAIEQEFNKPNPYQITPKWYNSLIKQRKTVSRKLTLKDCVIVLLQEELASLDPSNPNDVEQYKRWVTFIDQVSRLRADETHKISPITTISGIKSGINTKYNYNLYHEAYNQYKSISLYMMRLSTFDIAKELKQYETNDNLDRYFVLDDIILVNHIYELRDMLRSKGIYDFSSQRLGAVNSRFDLDNIEQKNDFPSISALNYSQLSMNDILYVQDGLVQLKLDWIIAFLHLGSYIYDSDSAWTIDQLKQGFKSDVGDYQKYVERDSVNPTDPDTMDTNLCGFLNYRGGMISLALFVQSFNRIQTSTFLSDEVRNKIETIENDVLKESLELFGQYRNKYNRQYNAFASVQYILQDLNITNNPFLQKYKDEVLFKGIPSSKFPFLQNDQTLEDSYKEYDTSLGELKAILMKMLQQYLAHVLYKHLSSIMFVYLLAFANIPIIEQNLIGLMKQIDASGSEIVHPKIVNKSASFKLFYDMLNLVDIKKYNVLQSNPLNNVDDLKDLVDDYIKDQTNIDLIQHMLELYRPYYT